MLWRSNCFTHLRHRHPLSLIKAHHKPSFSTNTAATGESALGIELQFSQAIDENIDNDDEEVLTKDGKVLDTRRFVAQVSGLANASLGQSVSFTNESTGFIVSLKKKLATVLLTTHRTPPIGTVATLLDDHHNSGTTTTIGKVVPSIVSRTCSHKKLATGISLIDLLQPIGFGERLAIVGPRNSGKSVLALDIINHLSDDDSIHCIYASVGKSASKLAQLKSHLSQNVTVVSSTDDEPLPVQYQTPFTAAASLPKKDVVLVIDDLGTHDAITKEIQRAVSVNENKRRSDVLPSYYVSQLLESAGVFLNESSLSIIACVTTTDQNSDVAEKIVSATDSVITLSETRYPRIQTLFSKTEESSDNSIGADKMSIRAFDSTSRFICDLLNDFVMKSRRIQTDVNSASVARKVFGIEQDGDDVEYKKEWLALAESCLKQVPFKKNDEDLVKLTVFMLVHNSTRLFSNYDHSSCDETLLLAATVKNELIQQHSDLFNSVFKSKNVEKQNVCALKSIINDIIIIKQQQHTK